MARFAHDMLQKMGTLTRGLEVELGPDTADLSLRIGMHSGSVTAGVLRGERSRFQLFGDTMNTAARMEHNGVRDMIQCSQDTADLLVAAGKESWVVPRTEKIHAKGKGSMQTYFLNLLKRNGKTASFVSEIRTEDDSQRNTIDGTETTLDRCEATRIAEASKLSTGKMSRLIDWNCDVMQRILKQIIARRRVFGNQSTSESVPLSSSAAFEIGRAHV